MMTKKLTEKNASQEPAGASFKDSPTGNRVLTSALALLIALVLSGILIAVTSVDWTGLRTSPLATVGNAFVVIFKCYGALLRGSLGSVYSISETLVMATPLILGGLAVALPFQTGLLNIGVQGQMLMGGALATAIGFSLGGIPFPISLIVALLGGVVGGAIWSLVPGVLKAKTGASEVITTIMMNFIAIRLVEFFLKTNFFQVPGRAELMSKAVLSTARLPTLLTRLNPGLRIHLGFIFALAIAGFAWWFLYHSRLGFECRIVGHNSRVGKYSGIKVTTAYVAVMLFSGGIAGLAGASEILGLYGRLTSGFTGNVGFDSILIALLGGSHPTGVVIAGLLFGVLQSGGRQMQAATGLPVDIVKVVQALIIVLVAAPELIRKIPFVGGTNDERGAIDAKTK